MQLEAKLICVAGSDAGIFAKRRGKKVWQWIVGLCNIFRNLYFQQFIHFGKIIPGNLFGLKVKVSLTVTSSKDVKLVLHV